jgi:tRNA G18 (ribose-2'-O)-methylase SpoU
MNLDGNANIAMSIRTATVLGCSDVWIVGKMKYDQRAAVGAKNFINIHKLDSLKNPMDFFKEKGIQPFIVEQGGQPLEDYSFKPFIGKPVCFILGAEKGGFKKEFLDEMSDAPKLTISQYGVMKCLNVSISASIVMYEFMKQWRNKRIDL